MKDIKNHQKDPFILPIICALIMLVLVIGMSIFSCKKYKDVACEGAIITIIETD